MREQDWRANYYEAIRERNEAERKVDRVRALADAIEAESYADRLAGEDFDRGAAWGREDAADRIRALLGVIP